MCLSFAAGVARGKKEDETQAPANSCVHIYRSWPVSKSLLTVLTMRKPLECRRLPVLAYGGGGQQQASQVHVLLAAFALPLSLTRAGFDPTQASFGILRWE